MPRCRGAAALADPGRIRALALYEPTLFALDAGDEDAAAARFIDYWMGAGSWERIPSQRRPPIAASVGNVRRWGQALFTEPTKLAAFRDLDVPVLYLTGGRSTPSAHAVARLLVEALPQVELVEFEGLGHMGPLAHSETVNEVIAAFLRSEPTR